MSRHREQIECIPRLFGIRNLSQLVSGTGICAFYAYCTEHQAYIHTGISKQLTLSRPEPPQRQWAESSLEDKR